MTKEQKVNRELDFIAKSSVIFLFGLFIAKVFGYLYRVVIARSFNVEVYGLFSLGVMVAGWFMALSAFGLNEGIVRYLSFYRGKKDQQRAQYIFRFSLVTLSITSVVAAIILFLFSPYIAITFFHNEGLVPFLRFFSLLVPFIVLSHPFLGALRAHGYIGWYSFIFNIEQSTLKLILLLVFILWLGSDPRGVIFSYVLGVLSVLLFSFWACKKLLPWAFRKPTIDKNSQDATRSEILHYSIPLLFSSIISTAFYWIDSFALGYFKTAQIVGLYNAAIPIAVLLSIVPELIGQSFFPIIIKEYSNRNFKAIKNLSQQVGKWIFIINLPLFLLLVIFPGAAINFLFGSEYISAIAPLRILAFGALISSIFVTSSQLISATGRSRLLMYNVAVALVLNIALNYIFVPMSFIGPFNNLDGMTGAALGTVISIIVLNLLFLIQGKIYTSIIPLRRRVFRIALVALIPTLLLVSIRGQVVTENIFVLSLLGGGYVVLYVILIVLTKCLDENDISTLKFIYGGLLRKTKIKRFAKKQED